MTDMNDATDARPPMPTVEPKPGYKWVFVPPHIRHGKPTKPMWRQARATYKKAPGQKRGPKPGQPRMTNPAHATSVSDRLSLPLAFLHGMYVGNDLDTMDVNSTVRECVDAINDARLFIDRFRNVKSTEE